MPSHCTPPSGVAVGPVVATVNGSLSASVSLSSTWIVTGVRAVQPPVGGIEVQGYPALVDNKDSVTLANMRGNWTVGWIEENMPNAKLELVDTLADTVRLVGQGRAEAVQ